MVFWTEKTKGRKEVQSKLPFSARIKTKGKEYTGYCFAFPSPTVKFSYPFKDVSGTLSKKNPEMHTRKKYSHCLGAEWQLGAAA